MKNFRRFSLFSVIISTERLRELESTQRGGEKLFSNPNGGGATREEEMVLDENRNNTTENDAIDLLALLLAGVLIMGFIYYFHETHPILANVTAYALTIYAVFLAATKIQQFIAWFKRDK